MFLQLAHGETIKIGLSERPPYAYADVSGNLTGVEVALMKKIFPDDELTFVILSNSRSAREVISQSVDIVTVFVEPSSKIFTSNETYLVLENRAFVKKKKHIRLLNVGDLANHTVGVFQNSPSVFGHQYKELYTSPNKSPLSKLVENSNQKITHLLFWKDRVDILISDIKIFNWFRRKLRHEVNTRDDVLVEKILPPTTDFHASFSNKELRDKFDAHLKALKKSGEYSKIIKDFSSADGAQ
jgi:polar amino acid transport system substrate-binding protein